MSPECPDHCYCRIVALVACLQIRSLNGRTAVAGSAPRFKYFSPGRNVPSRAEEIGAPDVGENFPHLIRAQFMDAEGALRKTPGPNATVICAASIEPVWALYAIIAGAVPCFSRLQNENRVMGSICPRATAARDRDSVDFQDLRTAQGS